MVDMLTLPTLLQSVAAPVRAETLLVRPVAMPAPWYEVATGVFAVVAILLLLGITVALLGAARSLKGAESSLGRKVDTLAGELVPLLRRLNEVSGDLQEVVRSVKGDVVRLSGTAGAVDATVRDVLSVTERRVARVAAMIDDVTDEAQATVDTARGLMADVRGGAGDMVARFVGGAAARRGRPAPSRPATPTPTASRPVAPPQAALVDDDLDDDWTAEPLPRGRAVRARRAARLAAAPGDGDEPAEWAREADALIDEAERALGRRFGAASAGAEAGDAGDDEIEADPDDPEVQARRATPRATPAVDPWRAGGPRLRPR